MAQADLIQSNFTKGEITDKLRVRSDTQVYHNSLAVLENFLIMTYGGIVRSPGTRYVGQVKDMTKKVRFVPFKFDIKQSYILEFGHLYIRFFKDGGRIVETGKTITGATQANPVVITATAHGYENGDEVYISGVVGMTQINNLYFIVANKTANTFELQGINGTGYGAYTSGGTAKRILTVITPFTEADLPDLQIDQSADVLNMIHGNYEPRELIRLSHTNWYLRKTIFDPPPTHEADTDLSGGTITLTPAATTGTGINFTASASVFLEGDVDRYIIYEDVNNAKLFSRAKIVSFTSVTVVVVDIKDDFPDTAAIPAGKWLLMGSPTGLLNPKRGEPVGAEIELKNYEDSIGAGTRDAFRSTDVGKYISIFGGLVKIISYTNPYTVQGKIISELNVVGYTDTEGNVFVKHRGSWRLEIESWSSTLKYPKTITYFEGRKYLGNSESFPFRLWGSKSNDFDNFGIGYLDDDAVQLDLLSGQVNEIKWLSFTSILFAGCLGSEIGIDGSGKPLTPSNFQVKPDTEHGSLAIQPLRPQNGLIFVQRDGKRLREISYNFDVDVFEAKDLTLLSEHIVGSGIKEIAYQQEPNSLIWVVTKDGYIACMAYEKTESVFGWSRRITGKLDSNDAGFLGNPIYTAYFENIVVIPHPSGDKDQVWVVVKRKINGTWKRYIEYFDDDGLYYNQLNADSALTWGYDIFYGDGTQTAFIASFDIQASGDVEVYVDGVLKTITTDYTVNTGTDTITFVAAPTDRAKIQFFNKRKVTTISGLSHLEGETVDIVGDGAVQAQKVVTSGAITLDIAASKVEIGLPYTSTLETFEPEVPNNTLFGRTRRWKRLLFHLKDSIGMTIGNAPPRDGKFTPEEIEINFTEGWHDMDKPPPLFNGEKEWSLSGWESNGRFRIKQTKPYPLTILGYTGRLEIGD